MLYGKMVKDAAEAGFNAMIGVYVATKPRLKWTQTELLAWEYQSEKLKQDLYHWVFKVLHEADILTAIDRSKMAIYLKSDTEPNWSDIDRFTD